MIIQGYVVSQSAAWQRALARCNGSLDRSTAWCSESVSYVLEGMPYFGARDPCLGSFVQPEIQRLPGFHPEESTLAVLIMQRDNHLIAREGSRFVLGRFGCIRID